MIERRKKEMRWEDFEMGTIPEEFVSKLLSTIPREVFVKLVKMEPRFQKEFAGFRPEHIPVEKFIRRFTPYFLKDNDLRYLFLEEWVFSNKELLKLIRRMSIQELKKEIPRLVEKYGSERVSLALLFDGRAGIEKIAIQLWKEGSQPYNKKVDPLLAIEKELEERKREIEELEEQRDRLFLELEGERNRRTNLEDKFFSLKKENKELLDRVRELEKQNQDLRKEIDFIKGQEKKESEYTSQIHNLAKEIEKVKHDLEKERKGKDEIEKELITHREENKKLKRELFLTKNQMELFQNIAFYNESRNEVNIQSGFLTIICSEGEMPNSFYKIAGNHGLSLLVHTSKVHDEKLDNYLSGSKCVFILGKQIPESFREVVQNLCYLKQIPAYSLPLAKEDVFEKCIKVLCNLKKQK